MGEFRRLRRSGTYTLSEPGMVPRYLGGCRLGRWSAAQLSGDVESLVPTNRRPHYSGRSGTELRRRYAVESNARIRSRKRPHWACPSRLLRPGHPIQREPPSVAAVPTDHRDSIRRGFLCGRWQWRVDQKPMCVVRAPRADVEVMFWTNQVSELLDGFEERGVIERRHRPGSGCSSGLTSGPDSWRTERG